MFNMGGPIKQGIMHGIREPHNSGGRIGLQIGGGINVAKWLATLAPKAAKTFGNVGGSYNLGKIAPKNYPVMTIPQKGWGARMGEKISGAIPGKVKSWFKKDPLYGTIAGGTTAFGRGAKWTGKKLYETGKYSLTTPSGLALTAAGTWGFWPDGTPKGPPTDINKPGGYPGADKKTKKAQAAFAEAQRDTRVQKYLDLMGYDRSKKTAVADALIDASKIVSDRGTLETKNITRDLINPIIQATSKRFDKPEQIREAVGLMSVKAAIQKDLEDPQVKKLRALQIEKGELDLEQGFETDMRNLLLSRKDKVNKETLERYARLTADKYGEPFTVVDETTVIGKEPGIYMVEDKIFRVDENGQAKQIA